MRFVLGIRERFVLGIREGCNWTLCSFISPESREEVAVRANNGIDLLTCSEVTQSERNDNQLIRFAKALYRAAMLGPARVSINR
jgi:hypothetical protein